MSDGFPLFTLFCFCFAALLAGGGLAAGIWVLRRAQTSATADGRGPDGGGRPGQPASAHVGQRRAGLTLDHFVKYSVLAMSVQQLHRRYRDISTPHFMAWTARWLRPHFRLAYDAASAQMSLALLDGDEPNNLFQSDFRHFPAKTLLSERIKHFTEEESRALVRGIDDFEVAGPDRPQVETAFLETDFAEMQALQSETDARLRNLWVEVTRERPVRATFDDAKLLVKFMAVATLLPQVETGRLNLALDTFHRWTEMWLSPDLHLFLMNEDTDAILLLRSTEDGNEALARTPLFHLYESVHFARRYTSLAKEEPNVVQDVTRQYLRMLPVPPVSHKSEEHARPEYAALVETLDVLPPPLRLAEEATGIGMLDTGAAGYWHGPQLFKLLLALIFMNDVKQGRTPAAGVGTLVTCARWCASWFRPHWDLVVESDTAGAGAMALYPLTADGVREPCYYKGPVADFAGPDSPIILDARRLDFSDRFIPAVQELRRQYGSAKMTPDGDVVGEGLVAIDLDDPQLAAKAANNDAYIFHFTL